MLSHWNSRQRGYFPLPLGKKAEWLDATWKLLKDDLPLSVRLDRLCNVAGVRPGLLQTIRDPQIGQVPKEVEI
ncbi:hypothetical protein evm_009589 [Chilo suppressalis]|nr:hypothetical protein evm_009589 [Chilo suppressalis]